MRAEKRPKRAVLKMRGFLSPDHPGLRDRGQNIPWFYPSFPDFLLWRRPTINESARPITRHCERCEAIQGPAAARPPILPRLVRCLRWSLKRLLHDNFVVHGGGPSRGG